MAKKSQSRKSRKKRKPNIPKYTPPSDSQPTQEADPVQATVTPAAPKRSLAAQTIDWTKEYPYFAPDMRRLGVVVALMVMLLLALNFLFIYVL